MAGSVTPSNTRVDAAGMRVAIVISRFNSTITDGLAHGARSALLESGVRSEDIKSIIVPGAFEIPLMLDLLASIPDGYDALIALGAVIQGETKHFDYISEAAMHGISEVSLKHKIPIGCGVLTTFTEEQAIARSQDDEHNKGREAALAAIEMVHLKRTV
ncbi:MAG TPA: 6,7-dimethyl-8-ribityllumazine synthase [Candidatus Kapabacteria bacterium]|nr:6,7-dimethyl-8-ribityllumazine synthase [Candidatus Kapabacteria bacterium]